MKNYRVVTSSHSFDIQKLDSINKAGEPKWDTIGYYRNKKELLVGLCCRGLPVSLADSVPKYHQDSYDTLVTFTSEEKKNNPGLIKARAKRKENSEHQAS